MSVRLHLDSLRGSPDAPFLESDGHRLFFKISRARPELCADYPVDGTVSVRWDGDRRHDHLRLDCVDCGSRAETALRPGEAEGLEHGDRRRLLECYMRDPIPDSCERVRQVRLIREVMES